MRTRVKICGFTRSEDAAEAARLGADAIGLVFYPPSPRHVDIDRAVAICRTLPAFVTVVGLFVDEAREGVEQVMDRVPLDLLQFHGDEPAEYCRSFGRPYFKAVRMAAGTDLAGLAKAYGDARGLLLDADDAQAKGGTGTRFDWALVPERCTLPVILAGGLKPDNVVAALEQVRPYAVDVSSGVESAKGIKDHNKMAAFLNEVHRFDHGQQ
ncbi:MAG: phosphoribosylanthranilate isomerase [Methylococcaceae bacterium]|nr:phosphoribosylanthranilate isomerase [Methylococcaceae bacterium]